MSQGFALFFMFGAMYLFTTNGWIVLPEPLQTFMIDFGLYVVMMGVIGLGLRFAMNAVDAFSIRDRDIPRSEPWHEEIEEQRQPVRQPVRLHEEPVDV